MKDRQIDRYKNVISMEKFFSNFIGSSSVNCNRLRHKDLKGFRLPCVIGVSNVFAKKNIDYVKRGELILVIDCHGDLGSYINPILLKNLAFKKLFEDRLEQLEEERISNMEKCDKEALTYELARIYRTEELLVILERENLISMLEKGAYCKRRKL